MFDNNKLGEIRPNHCGCRERFRHGSGFELLEGKRKENYRWQIGLISWR